MTEASETIASLLRERGWSQRELARRAGITETTIRNILNGSGARALTISMLRRVHGLGSLKPEHFIKNGDAA